MPGHHGRAGNGWVTAVAVMLACVLLTAVGVAALRTDTASADTILKQGADAVLVLEDGTSRPAAEGDRVPSGATVRAGRTGAVLQTRRREVHLGGASSVTVVDGARQVLRTGFVMVDASDAPGLELQTAAATVTTDDDSLVRVDSGPLVRIGVLRGEEAAVRAAGRQATTDVDTYYQVQVPQGGLPGAPTPFVLTPGDEYERKLASELVTADEDLTALASRLDTDDRAGRVVLTALRTEVAVDPTLSAGAPGSEGALGYLIATASPDSAPLPERYTEVRRLRAAGGSWGIVAALVDVRVSRVAEALSGLLDPGIVPVVAGQPLDLAEVLDLADDPTGLGGDPAAPEGPSRERPAPPRGAGPGPGPSPTPSPSSSPDGVMEVVDEVVDTVFDVVSPSPTGAPLRLVPIKLPLIWITPSPVPLVGGLLE